MGGERQIVDAASAILNAELTANPPGSGGAFARRDWAAAAAQVFETLNRSALTSPPTRERLHVFLDRMIDAIAVAQAAAAPPTDRNSTGTPTAKMVTLPDIRAEDSPAQPGRAVSMRIGLRNDDTKNTANLTFAASDLVANADRRIPHSRLDIVPPVVRLAPETTANVVVCVDVPPDARPDTYRGLLVGTGDDMVQALLTIRVGSPS
jgi:hypothetical protein